MKKFITRISILIILFALIYIIGSLVYQTYSALDMLNLLAHQDWHAKYTAEIYRSPGLNEVDSLKHLSSDERVRSIDLKVIIQNNINNSLRLDSIRLIQPPRGNMIRFPMTSISYISESDILTDSSGRHLITGHKGLELGIRFIEESPHQSLLSLSDFDKGNVRIGIYTSRGSQVVPLREYRVIKSN